MIAIREINLQGSKQIARAFVLVVLACVIAAFLGGCAGTGSSSASKIDTIEASDTPATPDDLSNGTHENPVDFNALQAENADVYAWLYVPDTNVNFPVLQNGFADNFYLEHDMYGEPSVNGSVYSQSMNAKDFSDPVTLLYGHTFEAWSDLSEEMFGTLHNFEDPDFFDKHETFYIYTPDKILTYKVVSAYEYDDRHIMNSFDFSDPTVVQQYFDYVVNPDSMIRNVREGVKLEAGKDHIVQLSTCTRPANDSARYLITGALVDERPTS